MGQTDRQNCLFMSHSHHIYNYTISQTMKKGTSHLDLRELLSKIIKCIFLQHMVTCMGGGEPVHLHP